MSADIKQYIKHCGRCMTRKTLLQKASTLHQMDLVCINILSIEADSSRTVNDLVVTEHFTCYAQAFTTKDQRVSTVGKVLVEKFFVHYGLPARIHSDQGRNFKSRLSRSSYEGWE